jgi:hypothetical protein
MTRPRAIQRLSVALAALAACALVWLALAGDAHAQVFAPMCDESAASVIAPLLVEVRDHGEIGIDPCAKHPLLEVLERVPPDREAPGVNFEPSQPLSLVVAPSEPEVRPPAPERELRPSEQRCSGRARPQAVYRPPR